MTKLTSVQRGKLCKHYLKRYHECQRSGEWDKLEVFAEKVRKYDRRNAGGDS